MAIIGVPNPGDGDDADKQDFIDAMSSPIPHVLDDPGEIWEANSVFSQPTMIFVDAEGNQSRWSGALGPDGLLDRVEQLAASAA